MKLAVTFFTLYYLLRDRRENREVGAALLPLSQSDADRLFSRLSDTCSSPGRPRLHK